MTDVAPMNTGYSVSVLTTHSDDSQPSLLVAFDNQRYLFNAPEATSRIALQNKVGLRKVGHLFLGDLEQSAGLPGFILSSVEAGNDKIQVFGPEGTDHLLATCRFFTRRDKLSLKVTSPSSALPPTPDVATLPPPIHADPNLIVHAFTLAPSGETAQRDEPMLVDSASPTPLGAASTSPTLKRKRSSTSPSPPPRAKSPPGESSPSSAGFNPSSPTFNPSHLRGADASTWRDHVLRDMFRGESFAPRPFLPPPSPSGRRIPTPAYLAQSLPPLAHGFKPSALSYLVIGPRKRGKFLPEKAKALGVKPGKAFSKLIGGGRVWVKAPSQGANGAEKVRDAVDKKKETKKERAERIKREKEAEEKEDAQEGVGEGRWVEADECMGAGQDASAFLILNIPSPAHLPSLPSALPASLTAPSSLPPQTSFRGVFLFLGPSVLPSPLLTSYLSALRALHPDAAFHVSSADFLAKGKNEVTFAPSALLNLRLNKLDGEMFRIPHYSFLPSSSFTSSTATASPLLPPSDTPLLPLTQNTHFTSLLAPLPSSKSPFGAPLRSFDFAVPSPEADVEAARLKGEEKTPEMLVRAKAAWEEYVAKAEEAKRAVAVEEEERGRELESKGQSERDRIEGELVVTPLGTGSAIPSKYRNVSATLLHLPRTSSSLPDSEQEYILLDAGEGTWGQIARRFGYGDGEKGEPSKEDVLRGIKLLFISHLHQDHHAGVATLLRKRAQLDPPPCDPLTVLCPPNARLYLFEQQQLFDLGLYQRGEGNGREVRFLDNSLVEPGKTVREGSRAATTLAALKSLLRLTDVVAVPVLHRCRAWGLAVTHESGWKVVFSGDTTPCPALAAAGQDASLLVHEATIEDDMPEVAEAKGHSTFGQAVEMAVKMKARHLLLTHFSARYPKLPPLTTYFSSSSPATPSGEPSSLETSATQPPAPAAPAHRPTVATAFDLATLPLRDFWKMERYRGAMDALLSWDEEGDEAEDGDEMSKKEKEVSAGTAEGEREGQEGKGKTSKRQEKKMKKQQQQEKDGEAEVKA
ncbi:hypothetical protein JCM6882_008111 [Rhodosporidiobolus microsporus]